MFIIILLLRSLLELYRRRRLLGTDTTTNGSDGVDDEANLWRLPGYYHVTTFIKRITIGKQFISA